MKRKHKLSTIIFGIIIAIIALSNTSSYAESMKTQDKTELKRFEAEMIEVIEHILESPQVLVEKERCSKIYNSKNKLIYECRDKNDERLKSLLRRSDLVLRTDSSSYYLLGD